MRLPHAPNGGRLSRDQRAGDLTQNRLHPRCAATAMNDDRIESIVRNFPLPSLFEGLRRVGDDKHRGPCPFHGGDNLNGFVVDRVKGKWQWRCFTGDCGFGSAIDAHRKMHGGTFMQALNALDDGAPCVVPPKPKRRPGFLLVCDACGNETLETEERTYGNGTTRPLYVSSAYMEAITAPGWEVGAIGVACVGPKCLDRSNA